MDDPSAGLPPQPEFKRISKFLIPKTWDLLRLHSHPTTDKMCTLDEAVQQSPDMHHVMDLPGDHRQRSNCRFEIIEDQSVEDSRGDLFPSPPMRLYRLQQARTVGRACSLITHNGFLLEETACNTDADAFAKKLPLGKWDPRYQRRRRRGDLRARPGLPPLRKLRGTVVALNHPATHCYYHWLLELGPLIAAMHAAGIRPDYYLADRHSGYQRQILEMLGVPLQRVIQPHVAQHLECDEIIHVTHPNL
ncbi:MAG: hypothetical protein AAFP69_07090, partial [Planctomycetota bacterium]